LKLAKNIQNIARKVLLNESEAIGKAASQIDDQFKEAVLAILAVSGRVIVTGIGKSAIIANKIVATLNSTGTPAVFMHAADAVHGDLGTIQDTDIVICLSKSGETPEIKVLIPLIKRAGAPVIGLVSNTSSFLARHADYVLDASIDEEACPLKLAPTTSTTVHLAMGDALAVCLLEMREFSSKDFAKYHPGGSLGKQLYLTVDDIYPNNEVPIVQTDDTVKDVIVEVSSKRLGCTAVVDTNGKLVGIITDGDLRRFFQRDMDMVHTRAAEIMSPDPKTIPRGTFAIRALNLMEENSISQVIITDSNGVCGFVHLHDLLKEGII
jgi:arabinose-5-phosphate isomerase